MAEQESLRDDAASFVCMPESGTAGSWRGSIPVFPRKHHTDFHSDCRSLCSYSNVCECLFLLILANTSCRLLCRCYLCWRMTKMRSQRRFDFQLPYDERCWTILWLFLSHLSFCFWEFSIYICFFLIEFFCFLDISYWVLYWPLAVDQIWSG